MMQAMRDTTSPYLQSFEDARGRLPGGSGVAALRQGAIERFAALGLPGRKVEEWRYADLKPLARTAFVPANDAGAIDESALDSLRIAGIDGPVLVFVNGRFDRSRSRIEDTAGLSVRSLAESIAEEEDSLAPRLAELDEADALVQLNTAMMVDGYVIDIAAGTRLDQKVQILSYVTGAEGAAAHLRNLIRVGDGAHAEIVETYGGDETGYFVNAVSQVSLADGAELALCRRQREGRSAVHLGRSFVTMGAATLDVTTLSSGAASARQELRVEFTSQDGKLRYDGIQLAAGKQTLDTRTIMDHAQGRTESDQRYRGVLAAGGRGAFEGKVLVRRHAQKTVAEQQSASLLLDRSAEADAKPELEIYADDVKCAHGSTVGELDADQFFYLVSRGLSPEQAKAVLVEAFVAELLGEVESDPLAAALRADMRSCMTTFLKEFEA